MAILRVSNSGFEIACNNLKLHGLGKVLGTKQTDGIFGSPITPTTRICFPQPGRPRPLSLIAVRGMCIP